MAKKKNQSRPPRGGAKPPRQGRPQQQQGRRKGGLIDNPVALHTYSGNTSYVQTPANGPVHGTLAEEARNTAFSRRDFMGRDSRLRYHPVVFVSAGFMDPLKDFEVNPEQVLQRRSSQQMEPKLEEDTSSQEEHHPCSREVTSLVNQSTELDAEPGHSDFPLFTIDIAGDKSLKPALQDTHTVTVNSDDDQHSDSSDEVILFKGRDNARQGHSQPEPSGPNKTDVNDADTMNLPELTVEIAHIAEESISIQNTTVSSHISSAVSNDNASGRPSPAIEDGFIALSGVRKQRHAPRRPYQGTTSDEEAAIVADYIANMRDNDDSDDPEAEAHPGLGSHAFHMLRDLGGTDSDAIPDEVSSDDESSESSGDGDPEENDVDAERRRVEEVDERLARVLAMQEEMGLGGDDVVLFGDMNPEDDDDDDGWQVAPKGTPRHRKKKGSSKQGRILEKMGQYPSASRMAEAFDDLDLMDWHRTSLNNYNKKKGPPMAISDSELEEAMAMAWQKDRVKKAEKKKAREQLRSQGLLGKNVNPDDLRVKYRGGMSIDDMEVEFEIFLMSTQQQLILPPFDKRGRQTVHLLANKFKIKSQSAGKGNNRYPVLYRTKATLSFNREFFDNAFSRIKQTWFPRVDVDEHMVSEAKIFQARSGVGKARAEKRGLVTLREGEMVGQHAAELGVENKGRTMLEKMGWSRGMALGTGENKGIMVPITHAIKKTKAGLGEM